MFWNLKTAKFAALIYTRMHPSVQSINLQMNNVIALSYLVKMGVHTTKFSQMQAKRFGPTCWPKGSQLQQNTLQVLSTMKPFSSRESRLKQMEFGSQRFPKGSGIFQT